MSPYRDLAVTCATYSMADGCFCDQPGWGEATMAPMDPWGCRLHCGESKSEAFGDSIGHHGSSIWSSCSRHLAVSHGWLMLQGLA